MEPFRIARWRIDPVEGTLEDGTLRHRLEPKVMKVLAVLASRPGEILTKEELLEAVWGETHVQEVALSRSISEIRRRLGDDARNPTFIETLPKRGYRLLVDVEGLPEEPGDGPEEDGETGWNRWRFLGVFLAVGVVILGMAALSWRSGADDASLVVVPFQVIGEPGGSAAFVTGLVEDLVVVLNKRPPLRVKTATAPPERSSEGLGRLGRELEVAAVLDGSLRREGQQIRLTVRLTAASSGEILWSESYDRELADSLALQRELAQKISTLLVNELLPRPQLGEWDEAGRWQPRPR